MSSKKKEGAARGSRLVVQRAAYGGTHTNKHMRHARLEKGKVTRWRLTGSRLLLTSTWLMVPPKHLLKGRY
jgi:hypothetical protein